MPTFGCFLNGHRSLKVHLNETLSVSNVHNAIIGFVA